MMKYQDPLWATRDEAKPKGVRDRLIIGVVIVVVIFAGFSKWAQREAEMKAATEQRSVVQLPVDKE